MLDYMLWLLLRFHSSFFSSTDHNYEDDDDNNGGVVIMRRSSKRDSGYYYFSLCVPKHVGLAMESIFLVGNMKCVFI